MASKYEGPGCFYEPWVDEAAVGWKVTRKADGRVEYITLVPSFNNPEGSEDCFVYQGDDPCDGSSLWCVDLFSEHRIDFGEPES